MSTQMTDFLQTFLNLKQVQNQTEQVAQQARQHAIGGMTTFMELAKHTADPAQLTGLVQRFSELGVASPEQLTSVLQHVTPTLDAQQAAQTKLGTDIAAGHTPEGTTPAAASLATDTANTQLVGQNAGQRGASQFLSEIFKKVPTTGAQADQFALGLGAQTAAHMTPLQMVQDAAGRALPPEEILQQAGVAGGTRMTAAQDANNQAAWAGIRSQDRQITANSAYQMGSLEVDAAKARASSMGHDPQIISNLISAKSQLMSTFKDAKTKNPTPSEAMGYIGALNAINAQMAQYGLPNEGQIEYDPSLLVRPGAFSRLFDRRPIVSAPQNKQTAGAGRK